MFRLDNGVQSLTQRTTQITQGHRKPFDINTNLKKNHQHEITGKKCGEFVKYAAFSEQPVCF